jgi:hypothetical protein
MIAPKNTIKYSENHVFRGVGLRDVLTEVIRTAKQQKVNVEFYYYGIPLVATPDSTMNEVWEDLETKYAAKMGIAQEDMDP